MANRTNHKKGVTNNPNGRPKGVKESKPRSVIPSADKRTPKMSAVKATTQKSRPAPTNAFQPGNQLWKMRGTGRKTDFTPDSLWQEFMNYCQWVDENPWFVGKQKVNEKKIMSATGRQIGMSEVTTANDNEYRKLPYSIGGFTVWIDRNKAYLDGLKEAKTADFSYVVEQIHEVIRTQQFDGAVAGVFHAAIIARSLNMADTTIIQDQRTNVANLFPTADEMELALEKKTNADSRS